jgi:hypothetical protein
MVTPVAVFKDEKAPAFALLLTALAKYGKEDTTGQGTFFEWEPEILKEEIRLDFGVTLSELQSDKLQAAITVLTTNLYEQDWRAFEFVSHIFCNDLIDAEDHHPLEAEEVAESLAHATLILKAYDDRLKLWHDDVRAYVGQVFWQYGLSKAPDIFDNAIMPASSTDGDPAIQEEKNSVLSDLFQAHTKKIEDYIAKLGYDT